MGKHEYKFNGGQYLTRIGSSWLVSYMYYLRIDKKHKNWENVSNPSDRIKKFNKCSQFHMEWLQEIVNMNPKQLNRNEIGLTGQEVIKMADELLTLMTNGGVTSQISTANFNIHITYNDKIKLKEFSDLLNTINLSVNDYYRDNGVGNHELSQYSAVVNKVENGSIWLEIAIAVFANVTATVLAEYLLRRTNKGSKDKKNICPPTDNIHIETGDNCTINIHINSNNNN